jgi:hypothetical protein
MEKEVAKMQSVTNGMSPSLHNKGQLRTDESLLNNLDKDTSVANNDLNGMDEQSDMIETPKQLEGQTEQFQKATEEEESALVQSSQLTADAASKYEQQEEDMEHKLEDEEVALERKDKDSADDAVLQRLTKDAESTEAELKASANLGELKMVAEKQEKTEEKLEQIEHHLVVSQMHFTHRHHSQGGVSTGYTHHWNDLGGKTHQPPPAGGGSLGWFFIFAALGVFAYFAKQHVDDEKRHSEYGEIGGGGDAAVGGTSMSVIGGGLQTVPGI